MSIIMVEGQTPMCMVPLCKRVPLMYDANVSYAYCTYHMKRMYNPMHSSTPPKVVGKCIECKKTRATVWYSSYPVDFNRGGYLEPWCAPCRLADLQEKRDKLDKRIQELTPYA